MDYCSTRLLAVFAVAFIHLFLAMAILQDDDGHEPLWALVYFVVVALYGALYFRRRLLLRRHQRGGLYRGLGYTAIVNGALLSALFFYAVGAVMPLLPAVGVWLGLAIAAYFFYCVVVLHLEDEVAVQVGMRAPV